MDQEKPPLKFEWRLFYGGPPVNFPLWRITHIPCYPEYTGQSVLTHCVFCNKDMPKEMLFQRDLLNGSQCHL